MCSGKISFESKALVWALDSKVFGTTANFSGYDIAMEKRILKKSPSDLDAKVSLTIS